MASATDEVQPGPLLVRSKLQPPTGRDLVPRPELVERLAAGPPRRLTLISAPPGWGKSTLLAAWAASDAERRAFAWLSLDPRDGEGGRFWTYFVAALRTLEPQFGLAALELLTAPGVDMEREALPVLINEIEALPEPFVLVLDDYHAIDSPALHSQLAYLLEHLPAVCEVAIATRVEPPLPLARMRVRRELLEIEADELRFSAAETDALLNGLLRLGLAPEQVDLLRRRTEGWAAGLYLAALSLRHRDDAGGFISDFAGDDRHIVDYLGSEVLAGLSGDTRDFLLRTSVLERLSVPICDAVTGDAAAAKVLPEIERSNLFLIALDERREWYRYHHLFGDLLRRELDRAEPELVPELHRRAAAWLMAHRDADGAIRHTVAAGDHERAAELAAQHWTAWLLERGDHGAIEAWLGALPDGLVRSDARLCVARIFVGHSTGRLEDLGPWLAAAQQALAANPDPVVSVDVAAARSSHAVLTGDVRAAIRLATPAIEDGDRRSLWYPVPFGARAHARRWSGDLEGALEDFDGYRRESAERNQILSVISTTGSLALLHAEAGRWSEAETHAQSALDMTEHALGEHWMMGNAHTALALLHAQRGDRDAALAAGERAVELVRRGGVPGDRANTLLTVASLRDDPDAAELVHEARELIEACPDPGSEVLERLGLAQARRPRAAPPADADELSERELAVLRLLATDLSQREIGQELYVSLNTVKTHSRNIFRKLGVSTRSEAIARAREFGLIA